VNVLPGILLTSFGTGLLFPTVAVAVTAGVERGDRGLAGGLIAAALLPDNSKKRPGAG